ncbi:jerky homolog-like [Paramuricea clavata]|uniref:Jerky homolog-like n=1 Tax=Paramuricea clavata TaxID=317549 RepID=A0A6S7L9C6_PARCT|nr:jerky homolog-like [Paramuricea clavata]
MEKYPRASKLLVSEFKLSREAGSKVSELWLTKTMKSKIQMCYGEAAETFKGSHNWFWRFKKRHGIVLRRRTNKKKDYADDEVNMQWAKQTLVPGIGYDKDGKLVFVDNVGFQQRKTFHDQACRNEINASVYMLPENQTDKIQPVDVECGKMMKVKIEAEMERWLQEGQNLKNDMTNSQTETEGSL